MLKSIYLRNLLSFKEVRLDLQPLNVLIGPNGSGKSNLIDALSFLQAAPRDLSSVVRRGPGLNEWLWKGDSPVSESLTVEVVADHTRGKLPLRYRLEIGSVGPSFEVLEECLENAEPYTGHPKPYLLFLVRQGQGSVNILHKSGANASRQLKLDLLTAQQSVLHERRDPDRYPEITFLAKMFDNMRVYREWSLGRDTGQRKAQPADAPNEILEEDASNLAMVLNRLERVGSIRRIEEELHRFYPHFERLSFQVEFGQAQIFIRETGMERLIPATRLSDGTMRFLCLLAILCHPSPPPIVCIEEPELGLHPDVLPQIAQLFREASERTQLFVTTHSDALIDALSDTPESVVVTERDFGGQTSFRRLSAGDLHVWLEEYRLGQLWRKGELGGNLW